MNARRQRQERTRRTPGATALSIAVGLIAVGGATFAVTSARAEIVPRSTSTSSSTSSSLTPAQRKIAVSIARQEASAASPSDPGIVHSIATGTWPSYVAGVQAMANVTHAEVGALTDSANDDQTGVVVVRMTGDFVVEHSAPPGASSTSRGSAIEVIVDAITGQVLDFGVGPTTAYPPLSNAEVIFARGGD